MAQLSGKPAIRPFRQLLDPCTDQTRKQIKLEKKKKEKKTFHALVPKGSRRKLKENTLFPPPPRPLRRRKGKKEKKPPSHRDFPNRAVHTVANNPFQSRQGTHRALFSTFLSKKYSETGVRKIYGKKSVRITNSQPAFPDTFLAWDKYLYYYCSRCDYEISARVSANSTSTLPAVKTKPEDGQCTWRQGICIQPRFAGVLGYNRVKLGPSQ